MENRKPHEGGANPQELLLNQLRKQSIPCTIHTTNGYQLKNAIISMFDHYVIIIRTEDGKQMMLYKHAVSSITNSTPVSLRKDQG